MLARQENEACARSNNRAASEGSAGSCQMCMYSVSYTASTDMTTMIISKRQRYQTCRGGDDAQVLFTFTLTSTGVDEKRPFQDIHTFTRGHAVLQWYLPLTEGVLHQIP